MTPTEYQAAHSGKLKEFLDSKPGKDFLMMLQALRPVMPESFPSEHGMIRTYARIEGYDGCLRNLIALALPPKQHSEIEANYGVTEKNKTTKE